VIFPVTPSPEAEPVPEVASPRGPKGIRYAGSGTAARPGKSEPAEPPEVPPAATADPPVVSGDSVVSEDYWETEAGQFAGLVYPVREERVDLDDPADDDIDDDDDETGASAPRREIPELDDDAPPFATAPFASIPRLNRVRSMPIPPADEDE
jgi:hypothetical protein